MSPEQNTAAKPGYQPDKLQSDQIFALLEHAPFGRLATYEPPTNDEPGRSYVIPLQFVQREGSILIVTRPGRKVDNLRAHPGGVCMQIDQTEGDGWTSVCAWGDFNEIKPLNQRVSAVLASFGKYPDRTTRQASSWLRQHTPGYAQLQTGKGSRDFVVGRLDLTSLSGRYWSGLQLPSESMILRGQGPGKQERAVPLFLSGDQCRELLNSTPLAHLACYHPSRNRCYCLPFWFALAANDIWLYHPAHEGAIADALREHPQGVCLQADDLDASPDADPGFPWRSVLAEGRAEVFPLGENSTLRADQQSAILERIRARIAQYAIRSAFAPPQIDPTGLLIRLRLERLSGQATG